MILFRAGRLWRVLRRLTQLSVLIAVIGSPLLGGWQRLDRTEMAAWSSDGWNLPDAALRQLPLGEAPARAYEALMLMGGGLGVDYFGIPAADPVALLAAPRSFEWTTRSLIALLIPILVAIIGGRVFCGWFCPFGFVARFFEWILGRLPWRPMPLRIPERRPVRWLLFLLAIGSGAVGLQSLAIVVLPHLLVQQSIYAAWLLGGGGAVIGALIALLVVSFFFGPTTYCALLCPTGAVLGFLGRKRLVCVTLADPALCRSTCDLCDRSCWLQLNPRSGNPGPDCDTCARCFSVCPQTNMRIGIGTRRSLKAHSSLVLFILSCSVFVQDVRARGEQKPQLILNGVTQNANTTIAATVVELTNVKVGIDSSQKHRGIELSVFVARGDIPHSVTDEALLRRRVVYRGPLVVELRLSDSTIQVIEFPEPNSPLSTPRRTIYRRYVDVVLGSGDVVAVRPISDWFTEEVKWTVPGKGNGGALRGVASALIHGAIYLGLTMVALALAGRTRRKKHVPKAA